MTRTSPLRLVGALVVTTAAGSGVAWTQTASAEAVPAQAAVPLATASWHGRAILRPQRGARRVSPSLPAVVAPTPDRVRAIQRMLRGLGYRPGPVDGVLGPLTRAALQWFQIKHALATTGAPDARTMRLLRARTTTGAKAAKVPVADAGDHSVPRVAATPSAQPTGGSSSGPSLLAIFGVALTLAALLLPAARRRRRRPTIAAAPPPPPRRQPNKASPPAAGPSAAIGYAAGGNRAEIDRAAQAIRRACSTHGWDLAQLVRDSATPGDASRREGLAYALDRIADEHIPRLVVSRLEHAARTPAELSALLRWSARQGTDIVAEDVGLDTGTAAGRATARCLVAVGGARAPVAARAANANGNGNGRHAHARRGAG